VNRRKNGRSNRQPLDPRDQRNLKALYRDHQSDALAMLNWLRSWREMLKARNWSKPRNHTGDASDRSGDASHWVLPLIAFGFGLGPGAAYVHARNIVQSRINLGLNSIR
jgi:hypothetical protein